MTNRTSAGAGLAVVLYAFAGFSAASILLAFLASDADHLLVLLLRAPGRFLVESFHVAALYVPAVLGVGATLLLSPRTRPYQIWALLGSVVPFFTVALIVRIVADSALEKSLITATLVGLFGRPGSMTLSFLVLAVESAVIWFVWIRRPHPLSAGTSRVSALLAAPRLAWKSSADSADEAPQMVDQPEPAPVPRSLVDLPDPDQNPDRERELEVLFSSGRFSPAPVSEDAPEVRAEEPDSSHEDWDDEWDEEWDDDWDDSFDPQAFGDGVPTAIAPVPADVDLDEEPNEPFLEVPEDDEPLDPQRPVPVPRSRRYEVPVEGLLETYSDGGYWHVDERTRAAGETLRVTLEEFGIQAEVTGIRKGPVITMFEILPAPGVKLSKIVNLSDNIALRLAASSVRIVAPIPGKHAVGIEIPNKERAIVGFGDLVQEESFQAPRQEIPIALGKDIPGDAQIVDLARMPHVLIAGATGSGKSVCVNSIICSILYRKAPHEVKLILIDPKIVELKFYNDIPHLLTSVITDPKRAFQALQYCIYEMERRYSLLDSLQVRDIKSYNKKIKTRKLATEPLPYIVVVVDEFADLMATSGKELESTLARLAAMSRAVGIHLVLATQRPSTDVITGLIKANIPSRIAFMVASKVDSRIILDSMGAEKLLGRGDMLFTSAWDPFPFRMQGAFLSEEEVERVVTYVKQLGEPDYIDDEIFVEDDDDDYVQGELEDPLMEKAIEIVTSARKASASYLQRRLKVGYNRAARMVEEMERLGMVGPQQGSKPRDVIGSPDSA